MILKHNVGDIVADSLEVKAVIGETELGVSYLMCNTSNRENFLVNQLSFECNEQRVNEIRQLFASLRGITHKSLAALKDFIVDDETGYVLMEYIDGESLDAHLKMRRERGQILGTKAAYSFLAHICLGIEVLNNAGYYYGCLSPKMIFVTREGRVRIANYIYACLAERYLDDMDRDSYFGSLFCAPEIRHTRNAIKPAADVYSLALLFCELLSGVSLSEFNGSPEAFIARLPGVSTTIKESLFQATKPEPEDRFSNAQTFKDSLKQAMDAPADDDLSSIVVGVNDLRALSVSSENPVVDSGSSPKPDLFDSGGFKSSSRIVKSEVWIYQKDGMDFGPFDHKGLIQKFYDDVITESTSIFNTSTKKRQNLGTIAEFKKEVEDYLPIRAHNQAVKQAATEKKKARAKAFGVTTVLGIVIGVLCVILIPLIYLWNLVDPAPVDFGSALPAFEKKFERPKEEAVALNVDESKARAFFDPKATEAELEAALKAWEEEHRKKYASMRRGTPKKGPGGGDEIETLVFTGDDGEELGPLLDWEIEKECMSPTMVRRIRSCYDKFAGGRRIDVVVSFKIHPTGIVRDLSTTASGELNSCIVSAFSSVHFRKFGGTSKKVSLPIGY